MQGFSVDIVDTVLRRVEETKPSRLVLDSAAEIRLRAGTTLQLTVLDQRGEPVPAAILEATPRQALLRSPHRTDHLGQLSLSDLPAGAFEVQLLDPRYRRSTVPTVLRPGIRNRLTIRADPGAQLHGQVLLPNGEPAPRAVISLQGSHHQTVLTGSDGRFRIQGLSDTDPLRVSARLVHNGTAYISKNVLITPGETPWVVKLQTEDPGLPGRRKD